LKILNGVQRNKGGQSEWKRCEFDTINLRQLLKALKMLMLHESEEMSCSK